MSLNHPHWSVTSTGKSLVKIAQLQKGDADVSWPKWGSEKLSWSAKVDHCPFLTRRLSTHTSEYSMAD